MKENRHLVANDLSEYASVPASHRSDNTRRREVLKAQYFHANAPDKLPRVLEMLDNLLSTLDEDAIVGMNCTEVGQSNQQSYSYTVMLIYKTKEG